MAASFDREARVMTLMGSKSYLSAPEIYRVTLPHQYLDNNSGMKAGWMMMDRAAALLSSNYPPALHAAVRDIFDNDVIILRRAITDDEEAGAGLCEALRRVARDNFGRRITLVYESDDDYSGRYRSADVIPGKTLKQYIEHVDAVIASTKPLAELMAEESGGKPSYVIHNHVHYGWFSEVSSAAERLYAGLTVGLVGTGTHDADWLPVAEVMPGIQEDYDVTFIVGGHVPDYLYGKCEHLVPVHYSRYPAMLRQVDILCCSLDPQDPFNRFKSNVKVLEGWCAARPLGKRLGGCAVIASMAEPYRSTVQHRNNGLLIRHTPDEWNRALRMLIENYQLRRKVQVNGLKAAKKYDIAEGWKNWYRVYERILDLQ